MPIYEYTCEACGRSTDRLVRDSRQRDQQACACGQPLRRRVSASNFALKGGGWAKDGYSKGG